MAEEEGPSLSGKKLDRLLSLVEQECTTDAVQEILRKAKESDKTVRVSEKNKGLLISKNLRTALGSGVIRPEQVYEVLRNAEENGGQHIFLYRAKPAALAKYKNANAIAAALRWMRR
jgi:hypothetical protein